MAEWRHTTRLHTRHGIALEKWLNKGGMHRQKGVQITSLMFGTGCGYHHGRNRHASQVNPSFVSGPPKQRVMEVK